ncbi:hypothetical protein GGR50DRAFT_695354 [Xylaria sp. CBS 124048]|nr:hypothetical protein GGR50DRAFT_695354 [Xylaria sp. CBS 124048]
MLRIAIAGAGGLAALLALQLCKSAHAIIILSRMPHPEFDANLDCQVAVVDYHDADGLRFALQGVDLVISTISGTEQLNLIDAARQADVHTFVPSEFEGCLGHRPAPGSDPFDNGSFAALQQLEHWATSPNWRMRYTVFSCGVFYERFAPGGLQTYDMGATCRLSIQGSFLVDFACDMAEIPATNSHGNAIQITLTSAVDVARFVAAAVELGIENWPAEFTMRGARITPQRIAELCCEVRHSRLNIIDRPYLEILSWLEYYRQNGDEQRWLAMKQLIQIADGRYSMGYASLNETVDVRPIGFSRWLAAVWNPVC